MANIFQLQTLGNHLTDIMVEVLDSNPEFVDEDGKLKEEEFCEAVLDEIHALLDPDKLDYLVEEIRQSREEANSLAAMGMSQADFLRVG